MAKVDFVKLIKSATEPIKVIRKGNQYVRTKTVVTPLGNTTATLKGDKLTVTGLKSISIVGAHPYDKNLPIGDKSVQKEIKRIFFDNFENLFSKKNDLNIEKFFDIRG